MRELLEVYSSFDTRFPASTKMEYAREAASVLRAMIAEEARRRTRPPAEITPSEQVAEYIYQLRDLHPPFAMWPSGDRYPYAAWTHDGTPLRTPVHELVDLGTVAVPQLNEALDDRSFTRSTFPRFKGYELPRAMRVGDIAQRILEFLSGRSLRAFRTLLTRP